MIELKTLADAVEKGLNALSAANGLGISFKIHSDAGEYKKALKTRTEKIRYTNGLLQALSSSIAPVQNLVIATQNARLEVTVQLLSSETDAQVIEAHRAALDGYFKTASIQMLDDKDGNTYSVASTYSLAATGSVSSEAFVGTNIVFSVAITYAMVQNGLNSSKFTVAFDGVPIEYTTFTIARVPAMDTASYSDTDGAARNVANSSALNFNLEIPATVTDNAANAALRGFVLDGDMQTRHTLTVTVAGVPRSYKVVFGNTNLSLDGVRNAGYSVTLVEAATLAEG